jgi:hypothetical protein
MVCGESGDGEGFGSVLREEQECRAEAAALHESLAAPVGAAYPKRKQLASKGLDLGNGMWSGGSR